MKFVKIAAILAIGALLAACGTSAEGWRQIAIGTGAVISSSEQGQKVDANIAKYSEKLAQYCGALEAVAMGSTMFAPEKYQKAAMLAQSSIARYCAAPPKNASQVAALAAAAYEDVVAVQQGTKTVVGGGV